MFTCKRNALLTLAVSLTLTIQPASAANQWELLNNAGLKAQESQNYDKAEKHYLAALKIAQSPENAAKSHLADTLIALGALNMEQGKDAEAEQYYKKALVLLEKQLGAKSTKVAYVLERLGYLAGILHRSNYAQLYARAEQIRKAAIDADLKKFGPDSRELAVNLRGLASQYLTHARSPDAEILYRKAIAIRTKIAGPSDPNLSEDLQGLVSSLLLQSRHYHKNKYADAEIYSKQLLAIDEKKYGPDHVQVLYDLRQLASIYQETENFKGAIDIFQRLLAHDEKKFGATSLDVAEDLNEIGTTYEVDGDPTQADLYFARADAIKKKQPSVEFEDHSLGVQASDFERQKKLAMAVAYYKRALLIQKRLYGEDHQNTYSTMSSLARIRKSQGRFADAELYELTVLALDKKTAFPIRHVIESDLKSLAYLCWRQNKFAEAEWYYLRALATNESLLKRGDEVRLTGVLNSLALLYRDLGRYSEAELLLKKSLEFDEKAVVEFSTAGPNIGIAHTMNALGSVYLAQKKFEAAEAAYLRAIALYKVINGIEHPETAHSINGLAIVYFDQGRYAEAKTLFDQARKSTVITEYLPYAEVMGDLVGLARFSEYNGDINEAEKLYKRAIEVNSMEIIPDHRALVAALNNYAGLLKKSNKSQAADDLLKQSQNIQSLYSAYSADLLLKANNTSSEKPEFTVTHPLLKIQANRPLGSVELAPIYKKLISFTIPGLGDKLYSRSHGLEGEWYEYFGTAESDASKQLGTSAKGMSKAQLTEMLGPPFLKMGQIDCWKPAPASPDNWIYQVGGSKILLCLSFVDSQCVDFKVCSRQESFDFEYWRAKKLCASAVGKTVAQIITENGQPDYCTSLENRKKVLDITSADSCLSYSISKSCFVDLTIKQGVCVKADELYIAH